MKKQSHEIIKRRRVPRKGLFIDLDGTLLNDDYQICPLNVQAIHQAQKQGYKIYLVTGKSLKHAIRFYTQLNLDTLLIVSAGQVISQGEHITWQKNLIFDKVMNLINDLVENNLLLDFIIQTNDAIYASHLSSPAIKLFYEKNIQIKQFTPRQKITGIVGLYLNLKIWHLHSKQQIINDLNYKWFKSFRFHPWDMIDNIFIVHVMPSQINKWSAVKKVLTIDKINYFVTFGNGRNDIPILKNAHWSFAMANATPEVKHYAKQITEFDNNHCGFGKALQKFLNSEQN